MGGLWARGLLDRYWAVVVVACVLAVLVGGWVAYDAHLTDSTVEESRTVEEGELAVDWHHSARVRNVANSTVFSAGERVENRSIYFERVMPVLDVAVTFTHETDTQESLRIAVDRQIVVRNVDSARNDEGTRTVYWKRTQDAGSTIETLEPDEGHRSTFQLNVTQTFQEAANESERLGAPGENELLVVVDVTASRADGPNRTGTFVLTADDDRGTYVAQGDAGAIRFNSTQTTTVPVRPGPVRAYGGPLLLVLGLVGTGLLARPGRREALALSANERARFAYRNHTKEYADWITTGRLPSAAFEQPTIEVDSLEGLVDVAIDADERVIRDSERGGYHVVHDVYRYEYTPPENATAIDSKADESTTAPDVSDSAALPDTDAEDQGP